MKFLTLALALAFFAGVLAAQNTAPVVTVSNNGTPIPNAGGVNVAANSPFNSMGLSYDVTDAQNDSVSVTATVTNTAAAVNWDETTFNRTAMATPWTDTVMSTSGEFGPANTVHTVVLTFNDGTDDTVFSFTISVDTSTSGGGLPGDDGGSCTADTGTSLPFGLACCAAFALLWRRRASA